MTEEESSIVDRLADPDSLLGMLQRGRGKGYLLALEKPPEEVWPLLTECVINDPRLDRQLEGRAEYYAALIVSTGMDLGPLATDLRENDVPDSDCDCYLGLILSTLDCLAEEWDHRVAMQILRDYVAYGREWLWVVRVLGDLDMPGALEGIDEVLVHRINSNPDVHTEFVRAVERDWKWYCKLDEDQRKGVCLLLPIYEPWQTFCRRNTRLASLFAEMGIAYDQPPAPPEEVTEAEIRELSLRETFTSVNESNRVRFWRFLPEKVSGDDEEFLIQQASSENWCRRMLAFRGLGQLGTPRAFEALKSYIAVTTDRDRGARRYAYIAFDAMPPELTLETARVWFRSGQHHLHIAAGGVLERHATLDDVPILIEALRAPETLRCEDFRLSSALEALALFDDIGPIPELEAVFCEVVHCRQRHRAAVAMEITSPLHFQHHYAFECLWDCHADTRELGCDTVNLTIPGALERLKELAEDEDEYENVREAAQKRLEGF